MEDATKAIMREFDLTAPLVGIQNNHAVNWNIVMSDHYDDNETMLKTVPFEHMTLRRLWAHYRRTHVGSELTNKYNKNISDLPALDSAELTWYVDNKFDEIFDNFLKHDIALEPSDPQRPQRPQRPLYLVFCLESGDEILIRRVFSDEEDSYFQIINCEFSRLAGTFSRNQLGPIRIERGVSGEMISIFISTDSQ